MKLFPNKSRRRREQGVAVVVVLALMSIMLIYIAANIRAIQNVGAELKLLERQQILRLNVCAGGTNSVGVPLTAPGANAPATAPEKPVPPTPN